MITLDTLWLLLSFTLLSPVFVVPLAFLLPEHDLSSSSRWIYAATSIGIYALPWLNNVLNNALWRRGAKRLLGGHKLDWSNQIVLVTGGASGIGQMLVEILAVKGVMVVVLDVVKGFAQSDDVHYYQCDVSDRARVLEVAQTIREEVGNPTTLINNAGIVRFDSILKMSEKDVRRTFDINTLSHYWTVQAFLPAMLAQKAGHIVTISSVLSYIGSAQIAPYCASKAAAMSFHESLRAELSGSGINTTLVVPGTVSTQLFASKPASGWIESFLAPAVEPHDLAMSIIAQLETDESGDVYLPVYSRWTWLLRGLPDWIRDVLSRSTSMATIQEWRAKEK